MIKRVIKRDGRISKFSSPKIVKAVIRAMEAIDEVNEDLAEQIAEKVSAIISESVEVSVEEIQDEVENAIILLGKVKLAKAYMQYRAKRAEARTLGESLGVKDDLHCNPNALALMDKRYLRTINGVKETPSQLFGRVSKAIASVETKFGGNPSRWEKTFYNTMVNRMFMPCTPCLANSGNPRLNYLFACLSGDTVVRCVAGDYTIKELSEGILGDSFDVITIKDNDKVGISKAFYAHKTGTKELYRVSFDDGSYVDSTLDHEFMLRDGSFLPASELSYGQSVMPFNNDLNHGYQIVFEGIDKFPIPTHKLVVKEYDIKPEVNEVIHHKNYIKRDNSISNLEVMDKKEHIGWHMKNASEFNPMYLPEVREKISKQMMGNKRALGCKRSDEYKLYKSLNNPMYRADVKKKITQSAEAKRVDFVCPSCSNVIRLAPYKASKRKFCSLSCSSKGVNNANYKHGKNVKAGYNHRVVSVEYIGIDDVYDMSVEGTHNFAANNVFIHNCYAFSIGDSIEEIFQTVKDCAIVQKTGGGVGLDLSNIRPEGDHVLATEGVASGPLDFMKAFDTTTDVIKQGGIRRGGNLGLMLISHPDIIKFIQCKNDENKFNNFNISVAITDEFMVAVENDEDFSLVNPSSNKVTSRVNARQLYRMMAESAWLNGEPGFVFWDTIEKANPTPSMGHLIVNLCGEQSLLPDEACCLGSINLEKFVDDDKIVYTSLRKVVHTAVRFLDNVLDESNYPLDKIEETCKGNRKIGLGVMGFANMLFRLGIPYDSDEGVVLAEEIMTFIDKEAKKYSIKLAEERGVFPNFEISTVETPRRNSTLTTIAPTGSISIIAETSSGIEPAFAIVYQKANILDGDSFFEMNPVFEEIGKKEGWFNPELINKIIRNQGSVQGIAEVPENWQKVFVTALEIAPEDHLKMQSAFQKHIDNAISKTINLPYESNVSEVEKIIMSAWKLGIKGLTVFRNGSRSKQILEPICIECEGEDGVCSLEI